MDVSRFKCFHFGGLSCARKAGMMDLVDVLLQAHTQHVDAAPVPRRWVRDEIAGNLCFS